ncbi:Cytochrome c, mono-and diheme variants [Roseivivax lentus]|uniref:Cytochrome c, mono-and diheme variants n=1 Tax=Roseivivax lentus TaxID=633194 RepID=A0A1N7NQC5_9RHOB|nr:cytochrome c [Roseivivax lentus]SIT00450.1 Cytochrome c, mono-and diheme variants [Roseivivax lentus]
MTSHLTLTAGTGPIRGALGAALIGLMLSSPAAAFDREAQVKLGQSEYMAHCASCHGASGGGDGPVAEVLANKPPDLTAITARYSGTFPEEAIRQLIDGRNMINPHGDRGMPVWGYRYFQSATERAAGVPHDVDAQALAFGRVSALVTYLESIQTE